ncbi:MAG TPA: ribonuclease P protein component [Rhizomicrobium sp.]|jgi:ribonuclease P protein component|nr:ribonuclease P protein component [Rhizomicrobium sp.]
MGEKIRMDRLRKRADFLRAQKGVRRSAGCLTLECCATPDEAVGAGIRVGFTASRKVGNAVARNRAKRRLRAAAAALLPLLAKGGNDYVLVARRDTLTRPYPALLKDLEAALCAAHDRLAPLNEQRLKGSS